MNIKTSSSVGLFDAKTHLSEILAEVETGREIAITRRGKPVAIICPFPAANADQTELMAEIAAFRKKIKGTIDVRSLIQEGRR